MIPKIYFFFILIFAVAVVPAYADTVTRHENYQVRDYQNGTYTTTMGMPDYVWNGSQWVDRIISNNGTHFNVYSDMGSFSFRKSDCAITQYQAGFNPITETAGTEDIAIGSWQWTVARKNGGSWTTIDPNLFSCNITTSANATGKYLSMKRTDPSSGSYLKVDLAGKNDAPVEDFNELFMNRTTWNGQKFGFVLRMSDVKIDSVLLKNGTTMQIQNGITNLNFSQVTSDSMYFVKNGNAFYFDWMKAKNKINNVIINKTGDNVNIDIMFTRNAATLATGQKMFMDPTYGYTAGTLKRALDTASAGTACGPGTSTGASGGQSKDASTGSGNCTLVSVEWDITTIPTAIVVTNSNFRTDTTGTANGINCDIKAMAAQPSTLGGAALMADIQDGTVYVNDNAFCASDQTDVVVDLGTSADSSIQTAANAAQGWWAVGLPYDNMVRDVLGHQVTFGTSELEVTYTLAVHPNAVTTLTASNINADRLTLTWAAPNLNGGTLSGYNINSTTPWSSNPSTVVTATTGSSAVTAAVSGLTANTQYSFRVTAITQLGKNITGADIENATTLAFNQANFTVGSLSFDATNDDVIPIFFERDDINNTSLYLNVTYPDTWELACDFRYKFAMENKTYRNLSFVTIDADSIESSFQFNDVDREIINVECWNQNGTGEGTYLITQSTFPLLEYIERFDDGRYGTEGNFGSLDLVYLAVVIVSLVGLNRTNESVGAGFMIIITAVMAYFEFITIPTAAISGIGLAVMLIIITTRKD